MTPDQKRLADRILKLLALASSTTFAAEAETARRMADELMRTHNISLGPGKPAQSAIERRYYVPFAKGMRWEGIIACALADLCSCTIFFDSGTLAVYVLVGSIGNLDVLEYMLHEVNRQRIAAWLDYKGKGGADSFNKFCYGFAKAIENKNQYPHPSRRGGGSSRQAQAVVRNQHPRAPGSIDHSFHGQRVFGGWPRGRRRRLAPPRRAGRAAKADRSRMKKWPSSWPR
jgi:hypothetical protein